ncbi:NUMOD4 motif-containing HNH endonuclease [Nocardia sp. NPDC056611]|uniref:NUMOD4 motif-containing HNH endonuclease n=1 Tax=Nocardia sp. NPDC056611 TaxID=3345877 RepID=UPI00366F4E45
MSESPERWLPVVGWEGLYSVSDRGRVKAEARTLTRKDGILQRRREKVLSPGTTPTGYLTHSLSKEGVTTTVPVHRLVLEAFVGPRPQGWHACHGEGGNQDNRVGNLRWGTIEDNMQDRIRHGNNPMLNKTHCPRGHEYTPENIYRRPGKVARNCRACRRQEKIDRKTRSAQPQTLAA